MVRHAHRPWPQRGSRLQADGERLPLAVKDLGSCDLYPQSLQHNPNGRFVTVCGDGEYIVYTALAWRNKSFGSALDAVWADDSSSFAIRRARLAPPAQCRQAGSRLAGAWALPGIEPLRNPLLLPAGRCRSHPGHVLAVGSQPEAAGRLPRHPRQVGSASVAARARQIGGPAAGG